MPKICFILITGLDDTLLKRVPDLTTLSSLKHRATYEPAFPAVTSTAQATLTTGLPPSAHGIICNGLYTHNHPELHPHLDLTSHADARVNVSFWEQSNTLLQTPRFWQAQGYPKKKTAMLFWQNSMRGAADIVLTPKPQHTPDGKTLTACWSDPPDLYATLTEQLGPFPLHNYWSPMAGLPSSQWIARAAQHVWQHHTPDLQLVYMPHLDYNLMRLGPNHPAIIKDLQDLDDLLAPLAAQVRADGGTLIIAGDYGMSEVSTPILPNLALRTAGLLTTKPDANSKLLVDYANSKAFAMTDHQIAHVYTRDNQNAAALLKSLAGVDRVVASADEKKSLGLHNSRAGDIILLAKPDAWFGHDWWLNDDEKPQWQFGVDIHNKPGFDPREIFFDREKKCIAQNASLVKGSHGLTADRARWPMVLSDTPLPSSGSALNATHFAPWLARLLAS